MSFLLTNIYDSSVEKHVRTKIFILESPECYKDTHVKTYDITKLTAEQKSYNVQYRNQSVSQSVERLTGHGS